MHPTQALIELHYLPTIPYVHTLAGAKKVWLEAHEHFVKQTWRNRTQIVGANGSIDLIIPLVKKSAKIPVTELEISYAEKWQLTHYRAINSAYKSSPYYDYFEEEIKNIFFSEKKYLIEYNLQWLDWVYKTLKISVNYSLTESYQFDVDSETMDLRNTISPKIPSTFTHPTYTQVFEEKHGFIPNLCILDWIFNDLPGARGYFKLLIF